MSKQREWIEMFNDEAMCADGFDTCIVGITFDGKVVYDVEAIYDILIAGGMAKDEAAEYFEMEISGKYIGCNAPIYMIVMKEA